MPEDFIFIYGPPASGKSTLGKALSGCLDLPYYDLDELIEVRRGRSIPEIFASEGEAGFRICEAKALQEVTSWPPGVCALGGGSLLQEANRALAQAAGKVLCLSASFETILWRLGSDDSGRPLLDGDTADRLRVLLEERSQHYSSFPLQLPCDSDDIDRLTRWAQMELGLHRIKGMAEPYDVRIIHGGLNRVGEMLRFRNLGSPAAVVSDRNVAPFYMDAALDTLRLAGYEANPLVISAGEEYKTFATVQLLLEGFLKSGLDRGSTAIALGGGVVGDLTGFAAAIYMRGIRWVALPTSLLAMVDASLGGKTGADLPQGKNLVGAFHPPALVLADPGLLASLPKEEMRNGLAEVVKHGVLGDPDLFEICCGGIEMIESRLDEVIRRAVAVKARVIQDDPFERSERAALNLGHTLAHGLEIATGFRLRHGEAVAIGMVAAARLAERMKIAPSGLAQTIESCLCELGLPVRLPANIDPERLLKVMSLDKKNRHGYLRVVLPERIGAVRWGVELDDPSSLVDIIA